MSNSIEYAKCSCGKLAVVERAEDKKHRDRLICPHCGGITVADYFEIVRKEQGQWVRVKK